MMRRTLFSNARALCAAPVANRTSSAVLRSQQQRAAVPAALRAANGMAARRWYSSETKEEVKEEKKENGQEKKENGEAAELKTKIEAKDKEILDLKDKYLRLLAEFRTLQDRSARDQKAARVYAIQKFAADLLEPVDNLDRALAGVPAEALADPGVESNHHKQLVGLVEGLKMTESTLLQALGEHGVVRVEATVGEKFDANEHEVTVVVPQPDAVDGIVLQIESKGYRIHDRLLRPAKVIVSKKA